MYATKQQDHEKRTNQEGSYSVYNYMYHFLMDNYEPQQVDNLPSMALESLENKLLKLGKEYEVKGGNKYNEQSLVQDARTAINNFCNNNGKHGDTGNNLGKAQQNTFDNIKRNISDLRW